MSCRAMGNRRTPRKKANRAMNTTRLELSAAERTVLALALEFYVRMALGQVSEIAQRLDLIHGERLTPEKLERIRQLCEEIEDVLWGEAEPWRLEDAETSAYALTAFLLDARLTGNKKGEQWALRRLAERGERSE